MTDQPVFQNERPLIFPGQDFDLTWLELDAFPVVQDFEIALTDAGGPFGRKVRFWSDQLGWLAGFPWWDHADLALHLCTLIDIPIGTRATPYYDLEQGWQILIFREGAFAYVMEGGEPSDDPVTWSSWFRVPLEQYVSEWIREIRHFNPTIPDGMPLQATTGWQGHACLACRTKTHTGIRG
jgi:hypothetical protein